MTKSATLIVLLLLSFLQFSFSQDWRHFTASDDVRDVKVVGQDMWIISGSGLTKMDKTTGAKINWSIYNSDLPDYFNTILNIDSSGNAWMALGGWNESHIIIFDGNAFEYISQINGMDFSDTYGMITTPDENVWILVRADKPSLFRFANNQFTEIPAPTGFVYDRGYLGALGHDNNSHVWAILENATGSTFAGEYDGQQWIAHNLSQFDQNPSGRDAWGLGKDGKVHLLMRDNQYAELITYDGQQWKEIYLPPSARQAQYVEHPMSIDKQDHIWLSLQHNYILEYDGSAWTTFDLDDHQFTTGHPDLLHVDDDGSWWMIYENDDAYYQIPSFYHYKNNQISQIKLSNSDLPNNSVAGIKIDELNNKWIRGNHSLIKFDGKHWTHISNAFEDVVPDPLGSNKKGGMWLSSIFNESNIAQFDGVRITNYNVFHKDGQPVLTTHGTDVNKNGVVAMATYSPQVILFDGGDFKYLDSVIFEMSPGFLWSDNVMSVAFDTSGQLYTAGAGLCRLEADSTWTSIPFPFKELNISEIHFTRDNILWVAFRNIWTLENIYFSYDGIEWRNVLASFTVQSFPEQDSKGNYWFKTETGLCKLYNNAWTCYNQANSPIVPDRVIDFDIDAYDNIWITLDGGGILVFNENQVENIDGHTLTSVSGTVYRDLDQNGIMNPIDFPLPYQRQLILPDSIITFSNLDGLYAAGLNEGDHEVKYLPRPNWHIDSSPSSYQVTLGLDPVTDLDFILAPDQELVDLNLFFAEGFPRCNQWTTYYISFANYGTLSEEGSVVFINSPNVQLGEVYPQPSFVSGDTLTWLYSDLIPFATDQIILELLLPGPDSELTFQGFIYHLKGKTYELADKFLVKQEVRCAFDPNDKIGRSVRSADTNNSSIDDPIQYTIRFQNTGNDTAFQVVIRDTLDTNLDLNTLEIVGSSHPCKVFLKRDRTLEFHFTDILLPDSVINEMASHGFVSYTIKPIEGLVAPIVISNTAHIFFDFNLPVVTNTMENELGEYTTSIFHEPKFISVIQAYPNPAKDDIYISTLKGIQDQIRYEVLNANGISLQAGSILPNEQKKISLHHYPAGVYLIKATDGNGYQAITFIKG